MSLCDSCKHMHRFERVSGATARLCTVNRAISVPGDIVKCSFYHHRNQADKYDLEPIAWIIRMNRKGHVTGFDKPKSE